MVAWDGDAVKIHAAILAAVRRPKLVIGAYALRLVVALGMGLGWAKLLAPDWIMAQKKGDLELFAPGAAALLRVLAEQRSRSVQIVRHDALIAISLVALGSILTAIFFDALAGNAPARWVQWQRRILRLAPRFIAIAIGCWLATGTIVATANIAMFMIPTFVYPVVGELGADLALCLLFAITSLAVALTFIVSDLTRALVIAEAGSVFNSTGRALTCLKQWRAKCAAAAAVFVAPAIAGPPLLEWCLPSVRSLGLVGLVAAALARQVTIVALCALHIGWWIWALNRVQVPSRHD
jgi:hypothetical protein